jgi:hypothetical protein
VDGHFIDIELDDTVDQMVQVILASLCGSLLADTTTTLIVLFPFCFRGDLLWLKRLEAISDLKGPHYHIGMATLAEYAQYSFGLQHNTATTILQHCLYMAAYEEHHISNSCELTQWKRENDLPRGGTIPPSEQDRELKVMYHRLSEAEYACTTFVSSLMHPMRWWMSVPTQSYTSSMRTSSGTLSSWSGQR